jgi:hypothetical protein
VGLISVLLTLEKLLKKCSSILCKEPGLWQHHGLSVKNSLMSPVKFTKNFSTLKILVNNGTLFQTMSLISSGESRQRLLQAPILTALNPVFLSQRKTVLRMVTKQLEDVVESGTTASTSMLQMISRPLTYFSQEPTL